MNPNHLVGVWAIGEDPNADEFATGYPIAPNRILTAAHLLKSKYSEILVRFVHCAEHPTVVAKVVWNGRETDENGLDALVLECEFPKSVQPSVVLLTAAPQHSGRWYANCFPQFARNGGSPKDGYFDARGEFNPPPDDRSFQIACNEKRPVPLAWGGASGASFFQQSDNRLLGVISGVQFGPSSKDTAGNPVAPFERLIAVPAWKLAADPGFRASLGGVGSEEFNKSEAALRMRLATRIRIELNGIKDPVISQLFEVQDLRHRRRLPPKKTQRRSGTARSRGKSSAPASVSPRGTQTVLGRVAVPRRDSGGRCGYQSGGGGRQNGDLQPFIHWPEELAGVLEAAAPGSTVLVLGDLGVLLRVLDSNAEWLIRRWREFGERLADRQIHRAALVPCDVRDIPDELAKVWSILPWDRNRHARGAIERTELNALADRLLALLSFAVVIEPRLLRRVRKAVPEFRPLVELESLVWQHGAMREPGVGGATFQREQRAWLEGLRGDQPDGQRNMAVEYAKSDHAGDYVGVRFAEMLNLGDEASRFFSDGEIQLAKDFFTAIDRDLPPDKPQLRGRIEFFRVVASHLSGRARKLVPALDRNWARYFQDDPQAIPPSDLDPARLVRHPGQERTVQIRHVGTNWDFSVDAASNVKVGSPLAQIRTSGERIKIVSLDDRATWISLINQDAYRKPVPQGPRVRIVTDLEELTLCQVAKPAWASAIGRDQFGLWAEFEVPAKGPAAEVTSSRPRSRPGVVVQRLRWIPPGQYLMGSPVEEPGRFENEGPQKQTTIARGFWLFDTPCTQALWEAVVGKNPSYFQSPTRPVEQVSWEDVCRFAKQLGAQINGLRLSLPTEAEWEYACRAGTTEATYAGPIEIIGDANAPVLDRIAWYGGNCGVDFELSNGLEVTWLKDRQHQFEKGGTHQVALKAPNAWGLYDMLGNVWEWCEDVALTSGQETNEIVDAASAERVVRGGSWCDFARPVRAVCRYSSHPGDRSIILGFRCRVQEGDAEQEQASAVPHVESQPKRVGKKRRGKKKGS